MKIKNVYINPKKIPFLGHLWTHNSKNWIALLKRVPLKVSYKLCMMAHTCKTSAVNLRPTYMIPHVKKKIEKMSYTFKL